MAAASLVAGGLGKGFVGQPGFPLGTAFVSNVGTLGLDEAFLAPLPLARTPIYLAVGTVQQRAVVVDGLVVARPVLVLVATADHRIVDGAHAGQVTTIVREFLAHPERLDHPPADPGFRTLPAQGDSLHLGKDLAHGLLAREALRPPGAEPSGTGVSSWSTGAKSSVSTGASPTHASSSAPSTTSQSRPLRRRAASAARRRSSGASEATATRLPPGRPRDPASAASDATRDVVEDRRASSRARPGRRPAGRSR